MAVKIFIPKLGANIDSVEIGKIYVKKGDQVKKGELLFEINTNKATFNIEADSDGKILELNCKEGDEINVLETVGFIGNENEEVPQIKQEVICPERVKATPLARKLAKENNIDIESAFKGTDKIIKDQDILDHINKSNPVNNNYSREKISSTKKAEIRNLQKSKECVTSSVTVAISSESIKNKVSGYCKKENLRMTTGEYIAHESALLLKKFPKLNAFHSDEDTLLYNNVNIGMAVNFDDKLLVPVIERADEMTLNEFSSKFKDIVMKLIKNEPVSFENCTFTVTDLSSYNALMFQPVINANQSAILGICSEYDSFKLENDKFIYDPKFNLILSFDHRVLDGKYALEFLNSLKVKLESPIL